MELCPKDICQNKGVPFISLAHIAAEIKRHAVYITKSLGKEWLK